MGSHPTLADRQLAAEAQQLDHRVWIHDHQRTAGGIFLKGFTEAIGIAVGLVAVYLALNLVVVAVALEHLVANPHLVVNWEQLLTTSLARRSRGADVQTR